MWITRFIRTFLFILFIQIVAFINIQAQEVAEFGSYKISLDEFEHAYAKNIGGWDVAAQQDNYLSMKNFSELYRKFQNEAT